MNNLEKLATYGTQDEEEHNITISVFIKTRNEWYTYETGHTSSM
jgi:hypothetical protein